ncbi:hypothetical protein [Blastococcus montanus]|uniref:hypothetical protein n=1 Tax=Blastococcus montanus TaxID=3144973 RepID=UPI003209B13E
MPAMRAKYAGPFLPYLLKQLLIGLGLGPLGWLAVNWIWGLVSFVAVTGVGLLVRVHFICRYGSTERGPGMGSPDESTSS